VSFDSSQKKFEHEDSATILRGIMQGLSTDIKHPFQQSLKDYNRYIQTEGDIIKQNKISFRDLHISLGSDVD
jgi:hypothetical protein